MYGMLVAYLVLNVFASGTLLQCVITVCVFMAPSCISG
jgi:hypothetical protein